MAIHIVRAKGRIGSWFVEVEGEKIPAVHQHWRNGMEYDDPFCQEKRPPWPDFIKTLKESGKAVLTKDDIALSEVDGQPPSFKRIGYIALFKISGVRVECGHLRFTFLDRIAHCK